MFSSVFDCFAKTAGQITTKLVHSTGPAGTHLIFGEVDQGVDPGINFTFFENARCFNICVDFSMNNS